MNKETLKQFGDVLAKAICAAGIYIGAAVLEGMGQMLMAQADGVRSDAVNKIKDINFKADSVVSDFDAKATLNTVPKSVTVSEK